MKLVLDAAGNQSRGGVTVLLEILEAAAALRCFHSIVLIASPVVRREFQIPQYDKLLILDVPATEGASGRLYWTWLGLDRCLRRLDCDVFLGLNGISPLRKTGTSVVFVQQSVPYSREALQRCPIGMKARMTCIRWITRRSCRAADHVLVQTEAMKETLIRSFDIKSNRISAFLPSAPVLSRPRTESPKLSSLRANAKRGTLLYVGHDLPYKNLEVVAHGLRMLPESQRPQWFVTLPRSSALCRRGQAVGLGTLSQSELYEAYQSTSILVMPSLCETVGLPMLEALRMGVSVLAADRPYAHAVCADGAAFFNPLSPADFAAKLSRLLVDGVWRSNLIEIGHALVRRRDDAGPYRSMLQKVVEVATSKLRS